MFLRKSSLAIFPPSLPSSLLPFFSFFYFPFLFFLFFLMIISTFIFSGVNLYNLYFLEHYPFYTVLQNVGQWVEQSSFFNLKNLLTLYPLPHFLFYSFGLFPLFILINLFFSLFVVLVFSKHKLLGLFIILLLFCFLIHTVWF